MFRIHPNISLLIALSFLIANPDYPTTKRIKIAEASNSLTTNIAHHSKENINPDGLQLSLSSGRLRKCIKSSGRDKSKHILVTGGLGFVGSHLVDSLMLDGHNVTVVDNLWTGNMSNLNHWLLHERFNVILDRVENPSWHSSLGKLDQIYHLASPASPKHYLPNPIKTIQANTLGTMNMLELASVNGARIVLASTSEVYGSPQIHPQPESYWGNVNSVGPRSCYDESKRLAEAMAVAYRDEKNVSIGVARIFNTYGPRMQHDDGRVVSNFITQALKNMSMTIYGDGTQTRSFQYISDLIVGLKRLMASNVTEPINLGNPSEMRIFDLSNEIKQILGPSSSSNVSFQQLPVDDPPRRRPDIRLAKKLLNWEPIVDLKDGLEKTMDYFRRGVDTFIHICDSS